MKERTLTIEEVAYRGTINGDGLTRDYNAPDAAADDIVGQIKEAAPWYGEDRYSLDEVLSESAIATIVTEVELAYHTF